MKCQRINTSSPQVQATSWMHMRLRLKSESIHTSLLRSNNASQITGLARRECLLSIACKLQCMRVCGAAECLMCSLDITFRTWCSSVCNDGSVQSICDWYGGRSRFKCYGYVNSAPIWCTISIISISVDAIVELCVCVLLCAFCFVSFNISIYKVLNE